MSAALLSILWLAGAPAASASAPAEGTGTTTISFSPVVERTADGNTFLDYTFTENFLGIVNGTRVGSGEAVIHADGSFNTQNTGIFTGTIAGKFGSAEMHYAAAGTFASAGGTLTLKDGTDGLVGVHGEGRDSSSATGPTSFAGTYSFKVNFSSP